MNNVHYKVYNFISHGQVIFFLSIILCIISCIIISVRGLNWGLDFTGGILIEVISEQDLDITTVRNSFIQSNFKNSVVQYLNSSKNIIIRIPLDQQNNNFDHQVKIKILDILNNHIVQKFCVQKMDWIGPSSSKDLTGTSIIGLLIVLVCVFLYLIFRFGLRLATGTVISLIHDLIVIFGMLSVFAIEINLTTIAALVSAISYSLNDNIVIFDRIRENFNYLLKLSSFEIFNISLSQVLNRTIITSITTAMVLLILMIFGGTILYEFSITLLIGVVIGTVSSIYIASVATFYLKVEHKDFVKKLKIMSD